MGIEAKYIWMDGELVDFDKATVHFLSPALHYGAGLFEGIRCYATDRGPAVFRLQEHMKRLVNSAKIFGWSELPYSIEELCKATKQTILANKLTESYIRPLIYLSSPQLGLNLDIGSPTVGIAAFDWKNYLGAEAREKGIRAMVSSFTRHHPNVTMTKAKTENRIL